MPITSFKPDSPPAPNKAKLMPYKLNRIRQTDEIRLKDRMKASGSLPLIQQIIADNSSHQQQEPSAIPAGRNREDPTVFPREAASAMKLRMVAGLAKVRRKEENML